VPAAGDVTDGGAPYAGFFGKLPSAGDFLSRGLSPAFRRAWDGWVTRHLGPRVCAIWPDGGLRFRLRSGGRVAGGVIVPSADAAGRRFPLTLIAVAHDLPPGTALDPWCDAALTAAAAALTGAGGPDDLWAALAEVPLPTTVMEGVPSPMTDSPALTLWHRGGPALTCAPDAPGPTLDAIVTTPSSG
jgi:type VI secretion system protein ImpM